MKAAPLAVLLLSSSVLAQGLPRNRGGGGSYTPTGADHAGQTVQGQSFQASAASGTVAVRTEAGAKACFDGATSAACITYEIVGDVLRASKPLEALRITLTDTSTPINVPSGGKYCLDGPLCTRYIAYVNSVTTIAGGLTAAGVNSTGSLSFSSYIAGAGTASLTTCSSGTLRRIYFITGNPDRLCVCTEPVGGTFQWINLFDPGDLTGTSTACPAR